MLKLSLEMSKMHLSRINLGDRFICHLTGSDVPLPAIQTFVIKRQKSTYSRHLAFPLKTQGMVYQGKRVLL